MTKRLFVEPIKDTLEKNYMPYAMSVIVSRAIPEIDGFKPSHRKLLYTMYKMGLLKEGRTKSANVVGQTMRLNPHGDAAIYETMVRLTKGNEALLHPFVDSKGNFGKQYSRDMQYAASRYTEVKLDKICQELFSGIEKEAVPMQDNYDGTMKEPKLLPVSFPSILVNANQGIAVGMASNICPFNLAEVCAVTIAYLKNPKVDLLPILKAPDFPSGATLLYDAKAMQEIYETGRGSFKLRSKYRFDKKENLLEIFEIPYTTTVEAVIDVLSTLIKEGKLKEIVDVRDETDLGGLKLTLDLRKNVDVEALMQKLYKWTPLESSFSCNFNLLVQGRPEVLGIAGILDAWISFRKECLSSEFLFEKRRLQAKLHLLQGLANILLDIDRAIAIIRETEKDSEVIPRLCQAFAIDELQANYIADIRLRNINKEYLLDRISEKESLEKNIASLDVLLTNSSKMNQYIIQQLEKVAKQYGQPRKTDCLALEEVQPLTEEDVVEDYNLKLYITEQGYAKKIPLTSLRTNPEIKTKEEDKITQVYDLSNKSELLIFTNQANCYKCFLSSLKDCKPSDWGEFLPSVLGLEKEERVLYVFPSYAYEGSFIFAFENGKLAKVPVSAYQTKTKRKKLLAAYYDQVPLAAMLYLSKEALANEETKLWVQSDVDKVLVCKTSLIPEKSTRNTQGVQVLTLRKQAKLLSVTQITDRKLSEMEHYMVKKIPSAGSLLKEKKLEEIQIKLL